MVRRYQATHPTWFPAPCPVFVTLQDSACSPAQQMLVGSLILLRPNCEHLSSAKPSSSASWHVHSPFLLA